MDADERIVSMTKAAFRFFNTEELEGSHFPARNKNSPRSRLAEIMSGLKPGEFTRVATEHRRNAVGLQNSVWGITLNELELPSGSFKTRLVQDEESGEWVLYVKRI